MNVGQRSITWHSDREEPMLPRAILYSLVLNPPGCRRLAGVRLQSGLRDRMNGLGSKIEERILLAIEPVSHPEPC